MRPRVFSTVLAEQPPGNAPLRVHDAAHAPSLSDAHTIAASQFVVPRSLVDFKSESAALVDALLAFHRVSRTLDEDALSRLRFAFVRTNGAAAWIDDAAQLDEFTLMQRFASIQSTTSSTSSSTSSTNNMRSILESAVGVACDTALAVTNATDVILDFVLILQKPVPVTGSRFAVPDASAADLRAVVADALAAKLLAVSSTMSARVVSCRFTLLRVVESADTEAPDAPECVNPPLTLASHLPPLLCSHWSAAPAFLINTLARMAAERHGGCSLRVGGLPRAPATLFCGGAATLSLAMARANVSSLSVCGAEATGSWCSNTAVVLSSHPVALHVLDAEPTTTLLARTAERADGRVCLYLDDESTVTHLLQTTPLGQLVLQSLAPVFGAPVDEDDDDDDERETTKLVRVSALREVVRTARLKRPGSAPLAPSDTGVMFVESSLGDVSGVLPRAIERLTRYMPLSEARTLLFNSSLHDDLRAVVAPVVQAARTASLSDELLSACTGAIQRLHALCEQNDSRFFLALGDTARVRREAYAAFWVELRTLLQLGTTSPRHVQLVQQMETLWPELASQSTHDVSLPMLAESMARARLSAASNATALGSASVGGVDGALPKSAARAAAAEREALASGKVRVKRVKRHADGKPVLPVLARGGASVHSLGTIVYDRSLFHNEKYIWPVGFRSSRELPSLLDPGRVKMTTYVSEIIDGGKQPMYRVTPSDAPNEAVVHSAPSGCWRVILGRIKQRNDVSVSGPEMFGFSDSTIRMLIQELPNARNCSRYLLVDFEHALEMQEVRKREQERIAHQLDMQVDGVGEQHQQQHQTQSDARRAKQPSNENEAHLWRLYDEARANAERDSLRAEYDRQSQKTARDFEAGARAARHCVCAIETAKGEQ
jgi:hypothetical protein